MLDDNLKIEKQENKDFPPLPKNIYQVELLDVNAEERPTYDTKNKEEHEKIYEKVLNFQFTLLNGLEGVESLRGRNVWANFVPTYFYISKKNGKNKTYKILEALLGRSLTLQEDAEGVTGALLNSLIGKQCRISVESKVNGDKTFDNITDYYTVENLLEKLTPEEKENAKVKKDTNEANSSHEQAQSVTQPSTPSNEAPLQEEISVENISF